MWEIILISLIFIIIFFSIIFIWGQIIKDASIIDIFWGPAFALLFIFLFVFYADKIIAGENYAIPFYVFFGLICLWAIRINYRITKRNWNKEEDFRYLNWRNTWGKMYLIKMYFQVYIVQAVFCFAMSLPGYFLIHNAINQESFNYFILIGAVIAFFGIAYEAIGDYQLDKFIAQVKAKKTDKKVLDQGLWKNTRHPNYFGQQVIWYGFAFMTIAINPTWGLFALLSPILITAFFYFLSTPLTERELQKTPEWVTYAKETPRTIPYIGGKKIK